MTILEFQVKYCPPKNLWKYYQVTLDCLDRIDDILMSEDISVEDRIGSSEYLLDTLLDVLQENWPDRDLLLEAMSDLKSLQK